MIDGQCSCCGNYSTATAGLRKSQHKPAARLRRLDKDGLVARHPYCERPLRYEYLLTEKGEAFFPVLLALRAWGETRCKSGDEGLAVLYTHRPCGGPAGLGPVCETCSRLLMRADTLKEHSPAYGPEREARHSGACRATIAKAAAAH